MTTMKDIERYLNQNTKNVEHRTEALISRATQRLAQYTAGTLPAKIQMEWEASGDLTAGLRYKEGAICPACGAVGTAEGEDFSDDRIETDEDQDGVYGVYMIVTVPVDYFSCPRCHLLLDRYELVVQAEMDPTFETTDDEALSEPDYGNDEVPGLCSSTYPQSASFGGLDSVTYFPGPDSTAALVSLTGDPGTPPDDWSQCMC